MVRVKIPYGKIDPAQLDMMAHIADTYSRGWGHITTRQNVQFHFIQLEQIPDVMRDLAVVGMTSREACGDTNRTVQGCHLAGACPPEVLDISAWATAPPNRKSVGAGKSEPIRDSTVGAGVMQQHK